MVEQKAAVAMMEIDLSLDDCGVLEERCTKGDDVLSAEFPRAAFGS